jgi:multimeric flavodoxin WrbA
MRALLINGSPHPAGCTFTALAEVEKELSAAGVETELFHIGARPISGCLGCRKCAPEDVDQCVTDDVVNTLVPKVYAASAVVIGSPVYYSGMSGQLKSTLDRVFSVARPKLRHKLGASVMSCRRGGASSTFDQMNHYFTIAQMHIVSSQYWNQVHGNTPAEVRQDLEGLQTMRTLGKNMAWLLRCIEIAQQSGLEPPQLEPHLSTNFIR